MSLIVLKHCTFWDGTSPEVREDMHVLVEGERIREISEHSITAPQAQVIDCQGKTLMPGLIDAHVHLIATSLNLGDLAQEPVSLTMARARHIAEGMLQCGFTTVRDAGGADWGLAAAIDCGLIYEKWPTLQECVRKHLGTANAHYLRAATALAAQPG